MTHIGLLSDTHGYLDPSIRMHFSACDEIWHAGDIGSMEVLQELRSWGKIFRPVFGNIDSREIQIETAEDLFFRVENKQVFITHIAGYPGKYNPRVRRLIGERRPDIVVCGHSHILKVVYDEAFGHLHINPGACGRQGTHHMRTVIRFVIDGDTVTGMEVIELGRRGAL